MGKNPNWMHHDDVTDTAKERAWQALAGNQPPQRAWYYSSTFREEALGGLLPQLRDVFWGPGKSRVSKDVDVKVEHLTVLQGVPILRVSMPQRLVASFAVGTTVFVLYKAMVGDKTLDFGQAWGGLRGAVHNGSHTVLGDIGHMVAGDDAPPPAAILRKAEQATSPSPPAIPRPSRAEPVVIPASRATAPRVDPHEVPHGPTIVPDSSEEPTTESGAPPAPPAPAESAPPRIVTRQRPPRSSGWEVFGGKPEDKPAATAAPATPPAPPKLRSVTPAPSPKPVEDDGFPDDRSDRVFYVVGALTAALVALLIAAYVLFAS